MGFRCKFYQISVFIKTITLIREPIYRKRDLIFVKSLFSLKNLPYLCTMKAKLTFDLDDIDDKMAHERCVKATDMALVLWEIMTNSYRGLTNGYDEDDSYHKGVDAVYEKLRELMEEHDINPHNLIR